MAKNEEFQYFTFTLNPDPKVATIEGWGPHVRENYELRNGVRMGERFPPDAELELAEDGGDALTDVIDNIMRALIISQKARQLLEAEGQDGEVVEYLPFVLKDKRGRKVKKQYCVANVLRKVDCLDWDGAVCRKYPDGRLQSIKVLEVDASKIPDDARLFRLGEDLKRILIRSDLLERLREEGLTGIAVAATGEKLVV